MYNNDDTSSREHFKKYGKALFNTITESVREVMSEREIDAYFQGVDFGLQKNIASLYEAGVEDKRILELLNKYWLIETDEAIKMLFHEKCNAVISEVKQYLKLQGYSDSDIRSFMIKNGVRFKIRRDSELLKMKDYPEKVIEAVKENRANKQLSYNLFIF